MGPWEQLLYGTLEDKRQAKLDRDYGTLQNLAQTEGAFNAGQPNPEGELQNLSGMTLQLGGYEKQKPPNYYGNNPLPEWKEQSLTPAQERANYATRRMILAQQGNDPGPPRTFPWEGIAEGYAQELYRQPGDWLRVANLAVEHGPFGGMVNWLHDDKTKNTLDKAANWVDEKLDLSSIESQYADTVREAGGNLDETTNLPRDLARGFGMITGPEDFIFPGIAAAAPNVAKFVDLAKQNLKLSDFVDFSMTGGKMTGAVGDDIAKQADSLPITRELRPDDIATGKPVKFHSVHNTEKSANYGARYGQDFEPAGRYMSSVGENNKLNLPNYEYGMQKFDKPLVIDFGGGYGEADNWKKVLSDQYDGLKGKELTEALNADGYDGVITISKSANDKYVSEIIDLNLSQADSLDLSAVAGKELGAVGVKPQGLLPNPKTAVLDNAVIREAKWDALERATKNAGVKRTGLRPTPSFIGPMPRGSGRYVGAGEGITSPALKTAAATKYMNRTQASLDAGIPPDYFYGEGRKVLKRITDNNEHWDEIVDIFGPTSTQVGPLQNVDYTARVLDQANMGTPTSATLYPNKARREIGKVMGGEKTWQGYKVERYGNRLRNLEDREFDHIMSMLPPNDRWEGLGTGLIDKAGKGKVPSGPTQVAFSDAVRLDAMRRLNKKRVAENLPRLNTEQMQELHWAAIRAEIEGRPLQINPSDTIQGSVKINSMNDMWEAEPGKMAKQRLLPGYGSEEYADDIYNTLHNQQGKDRIARATGSELLEPTIRGTGSYGGETPPGFNTQSVVSFTKEGGLNPASNQRVELGSTVRQYGLGQDARATNLFTKPGSKAEVDTFNVITGGVPTEGQSKQIAKLIEAKFGKASWGDPNAGFTFTDDGYRILSVGEVDNKAFYKGVKELEPELDAIMGKAATYQGGGRLGDYNTLDWKGGKATKGLLEVIDGPMNTPPKIGTTAGKYSQPPTPQFPGSARLADSPEVREVMGDLAATYKKLEAQGKLHPDHKLLNALEVWKTKGIAGLRDLVKRDLAPAAVLAIFAGQQVASPDEQAM